MSEEINQGRDMEPDPMFRIKCLKKQLQWMENQRYDLETTVSSLRAILKLIIADDDHKRDYGKQIDSELIEQAKRMIKL